VSESYRAPAASCSAELREKGSRFLALLRPAGDEAAARAQLDEIARRHADATHHCWAWRLGAERRERSSDAGEPAGTAGVPILNVLRGADLSDVVAVVVRWFGGTKLGKGGLARAYAGATREALSGAALIEKRPAIDLELELDYDQVGPLQALVHPPEVALVASDYGERVRWRVRVDLARREAFEAALADRGIAALPAGGVEPRGL